MMMLSRSTTLRPVKFLKAVDWVAMGVALLGFMALVPVVAVGALLGILQQVGFIFGHSSVILWIVFGVAVAWCAFRWKELNKRS